MKGKIKKEVLISLHFTSLLHPLFSDTKSIQSFNGKERSWLGVLM